MVPGEPEGVRGEKSEQVRTLLSFAAKGSQDMVAAGEECELQRSWVFFFCLSKMGDRMVALCVAGRTRKRVRK